jgi:hypothetical protein
MMITCAADDRKPGSDRLQAAVNFEWVLSRRVYVMDKVATIINGDGRWGAVRLDKADQTSNVLDFL